MYIVTRERELAQARALSGALAIAERAGWRIDRSVPILPMPFRNFLSIGVQKGPPIGVQKGPPSSSSVTGMTGAPFALVAA